MRGPPSLEHATFFGPVPPAGLPALAACAAEALAGPASDEVLPLVPEFRPDPAQAPWVEEQTDEQ